jgi:hypothetical protein
MKTLRLAAKLKRKGVRRPLLVIRESRRAGLKVWEALALLEKETGIPQRNVFGCDHGPLKACCHERVTRRRVRRLLRGPYANGVGWTQLTYKPFVHEANSEGGAHKPKAQMRVGFRILAAHKNAENLRYAYRRYNGSGDQAERYAAQALILSRKWQDIIV